jgi:L-arabinose transport system permease protein
MSLPKPSILSRFSAAGPLAMLAVLFVLLSIFVPDFLGVRNMRGLILSVTLVATIAPTMMLVLALREVDLSVGSTTALAGVLCAVVMSSTGSVAGGVLAGLAAGVVVGLVNGFVVSRFQVNSLIVTLATMEIVRGLAFLTSGGEAVSIPVERFYALGSGSFLGVNYPIWVAIIGFAVFAVVLNRTVFGRNVLAIGGNAEAARLAGVRVNVIKVVTFCISGLSAGIAGVILFSEVGTAQWNANSGIEFDVITAIVLGGVSLLGGEGAIWRAVLGAFFLQMIGNGFDLLGTTPQWQYVIKGVILAAAVSLDAWARRSRS